MFWLKEADSLNLIHIAIRQSEKKIFLCLNPVPVFVKGMKGIYMMFLPAGTIRYTSMGCHCGWGCLNETVI